MFQWGIRTQSGIIGANTRRRLLFDGHHPVEEEGMRQSERDQPMKCVISVLGKDRSGIVAAVSTALAECGANIDDISQTILDDIFSMTMLTTLNLESADFNTVQERLKAEGEKLGVQIIIQREDVFQYMYKI